MDPRAGHRRGGRPAPPAGRLPHPAVPGGGALVSISKRVSESGLRDVAALLSRRLPVVILCFCVLTGAAVAFSVVQEKKYTTFTDLLFRAPDYTQQVFGSGFPTAPADPTREAATNQQLL